MRWNEHSGVPVRPESATKDPKRNSIAGLNSPEIPEGFPLRKSRPIKGLTCPFPADHPCRCTHLVNAVEIETKFVRLPPITRKATSASNHLLSFRWDAPPGRVACYKIAPVRSRAHPARPRDLPLCRSLSKRPPSTKPSPGSSACTSFRCRRGTDRSALP